MAKRKVTKSGSKKKTSSAPKVKKSSGVLNIILWILGILILIAIVVSLYNGMTGNVVTVTGQAVSSDPFATLFSSIIDGAKPLLEYLLGQKFDNNTNSIYGDFFSMALLILLIVFAVVYVSLKRINFFNDLDHVWVLWVVSIAVSLLAVRFLTQEWLITILLPYSALGVVISAGVPFAIFFFIVKDWTSKTARKFAWIFFSVVFIFLYYARSNIEYIATSTGTHYEIYLWTALLAGLMFLFDGTIHGFFVKARHEKIAALGRQGSLSSVQNHQNQADSDYARDGAAYTSHTPDSVGLNGTAAYLRDLKHYEKAIKQLAK